MKTVESSGAARNTLGIVLSMAYPVTIPNNTIARCSGATTSSNPAIARMANPATL